MDDFDGGSYDGGSNEGDSYEGGDECDITVPANEADIGEQASDSASIEEPAPAKEEVEEKVVIPKAEDLTTHLGSLFKNLKF